MTAIEPPTSDRQLPASWGLVLKSLSLLACILLQSVQLMQYYESLFPLYIFNSLLPAIILLIQEYKPGLLCFLGNIQGTRLHPV